MSSIYTIPAGEPFLDRLAAGLWQQADKDWLKLSAMQVLLPTRRACRSMSGSFHKAIPGQSLMLPRLMPLGEFEPDDPLLLAAGVTVDLPPPVAPLTRVMLLAELIGMRGAADDETRHPPARAVQLAESLAGFLDEIQIEGMDATCLATLAMPQRFTEHWNQTLDFLKVVLEEWPKRLKQLGRSDPVVWRNAQVDALIKAWEQNPPLEPVIAAGSTGTQPATARLLAAIAKLPQGCVVLPGLDQGCDNLMWDQVDDTHPQYALKNLLERLEAKREAVLMWPGCVAKSNARQKLLSDAFRPAPEGGQFGKAEATAACEGLSWVKAANAQEETAVIALALRRALEVPEQEAMFVTADRALAERVRLMLRRWGIEADDSGGSALPQTRLGHFLSLVLAAAESQANAVEWLALLRHPLAAFGHETQQCRHFARLLERHVWRGPRLGGELNETIHALAHVKNLPERKELEAFLEKIMAALRPLRDLLSDNARPTEILQQHLTTAELAARTPTEDGKNVLWTGREGEMAAAWLHDLSRALGTAPVMAGGDYPALFQALAANLVVRPRQGPHARLSILGPLEARLHQADLVIVGGLSEGIWPPAPPIDPWLSRPMRKECGLPSPERRIALAAHDFAQLAALPAVMLTRAVRDATAPAVPSRFLVRVETLLAATDEAVRTKADHSAFWLPLARGLDFAAEDKTMDPPNPRPPADVRPLTFSVSDLKLLRRNPYGYYARKILKLYPLDDLMQEPDARAYGDFIHEVLHAFVNTAFPPDLKQASAQLEVIAKKIFARYARSPAVAAFWWPSFHAMAAAYLEQEMERRKAGVPLATEVDGQAMLAGRFTLTGRADRIDRENSGKLAVFDYKTGNPPKADYVESGYEPQLPVLSWIAAQGGFTKRVPDGGSEKIPAAEVAAYAYWHLRKTLRAKKDGKPWEGDAAKQIVSEVMAGLAKYLDSFAQASTPYLARPVSEFAKEQDDYAHLARIAEWGDAA